jgi:uncharacterized protein (UPF0332 family)
MAFNWKDFLTFAESIKAAPDKPGPQEAALRSAVSRAYYAAFQAALEFGASEKFSPQWSGEDHFGIRKYFQQYSPKSDIRRKIALELQRLYDNRRKADYIKAIANSTSLADWSIKSSQVIFLNLEQLAEEKRNATSSP